jgi:CBS domain-containing membrane protein
MDMSEARIQQVMTAPVRTLDRNDTLDVAEDLMIRHRIRHLPVVDEAGRVIGVVSRSDLFPDGLAGALGYGAVGQQKLLHVIQVKDVMSQPPVIIAAGAFVWDACVAMLDRKIGCLPVVEDERLVGIVTEGDLLRCLTGREAGIARA